MSDRIAVMNSGRFEQVAQKLEVYTHPATRFVAGFVGHSNRIGGKLGSANGTTHVSWNGTPIEIRRPDGLADGAAVDCFVKCEKMHIALPGDPGPSEAHNRLPGTLRDIIFKGSTADYLVALDSGAELMVSETSEIMALERGQKVEVVWTVAATACFAASAA